MELRSVINVLFWHSEQYIIVPRTELVVHVHTILFPDVVPKSAVLFSFRVPFIVSSFLFTQGFSAVVSRRIIMNRKKDIFSENEKKS